MSEHRARNLEAIEAKKEVEVPKEFIFYHTMIHHEAEPGVAIDFFAPKSEGTKKVSEILASTVDEIEAVSGLLKTVDATKLDELKRLLAVGSENVAELSPLGIWLLDGRKSRSIVELSQKTGIFDEHTALKKLMAEAAHSDVEMRRLREAFVIASDPDSMAAINLSDVKSIAANLKASYFLAKDHEGEQFNGFISFDIRKLLQAGFRVYEANAQVADALVRSFNDVKVVKKYLESIKPINDPLHDPLKFTVEYVDNPDATYGDGGQYKYSPYCPEYFVVPPSQQDLGRYIQQHKNEMTEILSDHDLGNAEGLSGDEYRALTNSVFNLAILEVKSNKI